MKKLFLLLILSILGIAQTYARTPLKLAGINIRDPFIYADENTKTYYLYGSAANATVGALRGDIRGGVIVYKSKDLVNWSEPVTVMTLPDDNWITGKVWAPEMHHYNGKYYLFATINTNLTWKGGSNHGVKYTWRGTQIFESESPEGPFHAFEDRMPATPYDEMALDGTLWVENGQPYMVYCHEWVEAVDGEIKVIPLKRDLSGSVGSAIRLFCASAAPWVSPDGTMVTDGCFLYRNKTGKLLMTWSSFTGSGYAVGIATSVTGKVFGPWKQCEKPLYTKHGGHAMLFRDFTGQLHMVLHAPNSPSGAERAVILNVNDTDDAICVTE